MLTVEKSEHKFLFTAFLFKKLLVVLGLSRQIVSYHLVMLKQKLFTNRFMPFSLRCKPLLFNIPKFIFLLSIKHKRLVRHCCLIKSLASFRFLSNLSFLITKLEIYTMVFSFFTNKPQSTVSLTIFSELSSLFRLLVPW